MSTATPPPVGERSVRDAPAVLVVEDNDIAALQVATVLREVGMKVTVAPDGEVALEHLAREQPDGVVLDLMMPSIDGFEVLERMRADVALSAVPVLVLTAKELSGAERARLRFNHIQQLIQKGSLDREALVAAVERLVAASDRAPAVDPEPEPRIPEGEAALVLVVEDNPDNRVTAKAVLDNLGYRVTLAGTGAEAVAKVREAKPDCILMDIQLPDQSGLELAEQLKADPALSGVPIIALTARAMSGDREEILAGACDDYLCKPLDAARLEQLLKRWLKVERRDA